MTCCSFIIGGLFHFQPRPVTDILSLVSQRTYSHCDCWVCRCFLLCLAWPLMALAFGIWHSVFGLSAALLVGKTTYCVQYAADRRGRASPSPPPTPHTHIMPPTSLFAGHSHLSAEQRNYRSANPAQSVR
jgi:hypothetical protein